MKYVNEKAPYVRVRDSAPRPLYLERWLPTYNQYGDERWEGPFNQYGDLITMEERSPLFSGSVPEVSDE